MLDVTYVRDGRWYIACYTNHMDKYLWLFYVAMTIVVVVAVVRVFSRKNESDEVEYHKKRYEFMRRDDIMTRVEGELFRRLENIAGDRYYIFPQVHLSSLLDHKVNGQNWKGALSTIQRKSVDFVLVDKVSLKTMYAVELDDATHDRPDRQERDSFVAELLLNADMPLVRLRDIEHLSDEDIDRAFREAHARQENRL